MCTILLPRTADRVDLLSRLFSREKPDGVSASSSIEDIFAAYDRISPGEEIFQQNLKAVMEWLTKKHQFALRSDDPDGIEYVFRDAFFRGGPYLTYTPLPGPRTPTYKDLMLAPDLHGMNWSFLANEPNFAYIKDFESKNLLVPVVGNFGGPKAIRAVGRYVKDHDARVTTFYVSNVEQYLGHLWNTFCASVASLPLDDTSTFIFSGRGRPVLPNYGGPGGMDYNTRTRPMLSDSEGCKE
jgi:hypothetical protein